MFVECFEKDSRRRSLSGALGTNLNKNNGVSVCKEERKEERKKTIRNRVHFSITIKKQNVDFVMMRSIFLSFFKDAMLKAQREVKEAGGKRREEPPSSLCVCVLIQSRGRPTGALESVGTVWT